ncbi:MAG: GNAT family N-acetyltransferase [Pseudomonadota bacterium]
MLNAPAPLSDSHLLDGLACGVASLDDWLKRRARANQATGASRTYVVADDTGQVMGYYCLASGALAMSEAPASLRRNMPNPIPMALLGRLAVDTTMQGQGLGVAMLRDAVERTQAASGILGIRGVLVHALSAEAKAFYERYGFVASPVRPMMLVMSLRG